MRVCVVGLWHLGTVTAACLASGGHDVVGLDFDVETIEKLQAGHPPLFEPELEDLLKSGLADGHLSFTTNVVNAVKGAQVVWVAYDTPVDDQDQADLEFIVERVKRLFPHLEAGTLVLISSQLAVGSTRRVEQAYAAAQPGKQVSFAYSPENLRLGKAITTFMQPDRVVVGVRHAADRERITTLLQPVTDRIEWMSVESAEMTKHAINAFLATSVVFANEIASICEMVGADAKEVERGLKSEQRIGHKAYLSPGGAFAGGTLARDIEFLKVVSQGHQLSIPLLESVKTSNDQHKGWVRRKLKALLPSLDGVVIVVWGLTYKPGTDTLRRSLAVELCNWLIEQGAEVRVHDPVVKELPPEWNGLVHRFDEALGALEGAQVLLVGTEWPEYEEIPKDLFAGAIPGLMVFDPNRFLSSLGTAAALHYVAVGAPSIERLV